MLPGETILSGANRHCPDCGVSLVFEVLLTCAYYVGTQCNCGPYSRETDYFVTREAAEECLAAMLRGEVPAAVRS